MKGILGIVTNYSLVVGFLWVFNNSHAQNYQWHKGFGGTLDDEIFDVTHDLSGNMYVIGIFEGTADLNPGATVSNFTVEGEGDTFFAKYDANGTLIWVKTIGSTGDEEGQAIRVDDLGNVYIAGLFSGTADFDPGPNTINLSVNGGFDVFFAKYDNDGNYIWAKSVGDSGNGDDYPSKMELDASGNVYLVGQFSGTADFDPGTGTSNVVSSGGLDVFVAKYDSDGNYQWANGIESSSNADDFGYGIHLNNAGDVLITGQFDATADFDPGVNSAYLTSNGGLDGFLAAYGGSDGAYLWANSFGSTGDDSGMSITTGPFGNIYFTGYYMGTVDFDPGNGTSNYIAAGLSDVFFGEFTNSGDLSWVKSVGGTGDDISNSIKVNDDLDIFITGQFVGTADFDPNSGSAPLSSSGNWDIFVAKYNFSGTITWASKIGGVGVDQSHVIDVLPSNFYVIAGEVPNTVDFDPGAGSSSYSSAGLDDAFFAKYEDTQLGLNEFLFFEEFSLFPNPLRNEDNLTVVMPNEGNYSLNIISQDGKVVRSVPDFTNTVSLDLDLPNGLFLVVVQSENGTVTKKLVIQN